MKIAVTGANGFIGQHIVLAALAAGHDVLALDRTPAPEAFQRAGARLTSQSLDLCAAQDLSAAFLGTECVVHLAAVMHGAAQYRETMAMTQSLFAAMAAAGVRKLIGLSSISILDYTVCPALSSVDESTPVNERAEELGPYALTKRDQEWALLAFQRALPGRTLVLLRPGIVYDAQRISDAHVGFVRGKRGFAASHAGQVPFVHVANVASATVAALQVLATNTGHVLTFNLVDDALPSQAEYLALLRTRGALGAVVNVPWRVYASVIGNVRGALSLLGKAERVPDSFRANSVAARQKPFRFSNTRAKEQLQWQPTASFRSTFP